MQVTFARIEVITYFLSLGYPQSYDQVFPCSASLSLLNLFSHGFWFLFATHLHLSFRYLMHLLDSFKKQVSTFWSHLFLWERRCFLILFQGRIFSLFLTLFVEVASTTSSTFSNPSTFVSRSFSLRFVFRLFEAAYLLISQRVSLNILAKIKKSCQQLFLIFFIIFTFLMFLYLYKIFEKNYQKIKKLLNFYS